MQLWATFVMPSSNQRILTSPEVPGPPKEVFLTFV